MKIQKQASVLTAGTPDAEQLEKINRQAKSPLKAEEVYVFSVRLCDDQPDRDHERFSTEALKALAPMFVGKTGIVDHAWSSEKQVARIFEAGVEYGDGCAFLKAWAYILRGEKTQEIIREIEAGIKKEVSVGCAMGQARAARSAASPTAPVRTARARSTTAKRAWPCSRSRSMPMNFPLWRSRRSGRRV